MLHFPKQIEYVVIFDADFQPRSNFLTETVALLINDPNLAFVQTCWSYTNSKESLLTRMQEISLNYHFYCEQQVRSNAGLFFNFNGTAGIWRLKAIIESGGWQSDTL